MCISITHTNQRLIALTLILIWAGFCAAQTRTPSARDVLVQFCELDAQGGQLSPTGQQQIAALFQSHSQQRRDKAVVIKDFVVSLPSKDTEKPSFYVEYINLGEIDFATATFSSAPGIKVRAGFAVSRESVTGGAPWKIDGEMPTPHVTVDTAIRYASEFRAKAEGQQLQQKAERLLAYLKRLR